MNDKKLIFAYGSTMNQQDLQAYCHEKNLSSFSWKKIANAFLENFTLTWNVYSQRRAGGVLNVTEKEQEQVWGVVLEIDEKDLRTLDKKEGHPNHYNRTRLNVQTETGQTYEVETYIAPQDPRTLYFLPTKAYLEAVVEGAKQNNLPKEYIQNLENTPLCFVEGKQENPKIAIYAGKGVTIDTQSYWNTLFKRHLNYSLTVLYSYQFTPEMLETFQLIILPGGSGEKICGGLGDLGKINLRNYVSNGGKVLGVCAGAYALSHQTQNYIHLSPVKIKDFAHTRRGEAVIPVEFNDLGKKLFGADSFQSEVIFNNGPIVYEQPLKNSSNLQFLGYFKDEIVHREGEKGVMKDSPFAWINQYGKGWVVGISPHFERTHGREHLVGNLINNLLDF